MNTNLLIILAMMAGGVAGVVGIGQALVGREAVDQVANHPESGNKILIAQMLSLGMMESLVIYMVLLFCLVWFKGGL